VDFLSLCVCTCVLYVCVICCLVGIMNDDDDYYCCMFSLLLNIGSEH